MAYVKKKQDPKYVIINQEGNELKNLQFVTFNNTGLGIGRKITHWTFSGKGVDLEKGILSDTMIRALKKLEEHGYPNCKVVKLTEEIEEQQRAINDKLLEEKQGFSVRIPESYSEAMELINKECPDAYFDYELTNTNYVCLCCINGCKCSVNSKFYTKCPSFESIEKIG